MTLIFQQPTKTTQDGHQTKGELYQTKEILSKTKELLDQTQTELLKTNEQVLKTTIQLNATKHELALAGQRLTKVTQDEAQTSGALTQTKKELQKTKGQLESNKLELSLAVQKLAKTTQKDTSQTKEELLKTKKELERTKKRLNTINGQIAETYFRVKNNTEVQECTKQMLTDEIDALEIKIANQEFDVATLNAVFNTNKSQTDLNMHNVFNKVRKLDEEMEKKWTRNNYLWMASLTVGTLYLLYRMLKSDPKPCSGGSCVVAASSSRSVIANLFY